MVEQSPNPRKKAIEILTSVLEKKISLSNLITDNLLSQFNSTDRRFFLELIYGVMRNLYFIDWLTEGFFRNKETLSPLTINNIRCAVYQIIFMRVPSYAATNEAVNIEKSFNGKASVVNGILRNFLRKYSGFLSESEDIFSIIDSVSTELEYSKFLSIKYSHPEWLVKRWLKRFDKETASLLKANNEKAPFVIAVKPEQRHQIADYLNERGFETSFTNLSPAGLIIKGQGQKIRQCLLKSPFFWIIQDEASQLVSFSAEPFEGANVLDACSSPGGKALLTAAIMKKGEITCIERDRQRFKLLQENIKRLKNFLTEVNIKTVVADVLNISFRESFDRIILDAPCSSLGVIRRNPDVRYRVTEDEILRLSNLQMQMLEKVSQFLVKDGILIYSVCSTEPEEGEAIIKSFLEKHPDFFIIDIKRTYPHKDGMDGFFIAKLTKK